MADHRVGCSRQFNEHPHDPRQHGRAAVVRARAHDPSADELLHRLARLFRPAHRHRVDALLHHLPADGPVLAARRVPVRPVALRRLHGLHDVNLHGLLHHDRPLLHGEDTGEVSQLAHRAHRAHDRRLDVARTDAHILHVDLRLAVLHRRPDGAGRKVLRAIHGGRAVQLRPADRLLLDLPRRHDHALHGHLPRRAESATEEGRPSQEDDVARFDGRPDDDADRHRHVAAGRRQRARGEGGEAGEGEGTRRTHGSVEHDELQLDVEGDAGERRRALQQSRLPLGHGAEQPLAEARQSAAEGQEGRLRDGVERKEEAEQKIERRRSDNEPPPVQRRAENQFQE